MLEIPAFSEFPCLGNRRHVRPTSMSSTSIYILPLQFSEEAASFIKYGIASGHPPRSFLPALMMTSVFHTKKPSRAPIVWRYSRAALSALQRKATYIARLHEGSSCCTSHRRVMEGLLFCVRLSFFSSRIFWFIKCRIRVYPILSLWKCELPEYTWSMVHGFSPKKKWKYCMSLYASMIIDCMNLASAEALPMLGILQISVRFHLKNSKAGGVVQDSI